MLAEAGFGGVRIEAVSGPMWIGKDAADATAYYLRMPFAKPLVAAAREQDTAIITGAFRRALRPYQRVDGVILRSAARAWAGQAAPPGVRPARRWSSLGAGLGRGEE